MSREKSIDDGPRCAPSTEDDHLAVLDRLGVRLQWLKESVDVRVFGVPPRLGADERVRSSERLGCRRGGVRMAERCRLVGDGDVRASRAERMESRHRLPEAARLDAAREVHEVQTLSLECRIVDRG